ncbi:MAG: hypothetical protein GQ529_04925, partial [Methyloprofundus sp.]|nr:hypothetical protein [Methyloprofundus sp.]
NAINIISSTFSFNFPEWATGLVILTAFSVVLLYMRHIGVMAIFGVAIIIGGMLISEYGGNLKLEFGKTTKQIPKGCTIYQDVIKNGAKITPEYRAFYRVQPTFRANFKQPLDAERHHH